MATGSQGARQRRDAMQAQPGDPVLYEGKRHLVTAVSFRGAMPPYFGLACDHARPCAQPLHPVSHWNVRLPEDA